MRITVESTGFIVKVKHDQHDPDDKAIDCRLWQGETDKGIQICCLIPGIAVNAEQDQRDFERDLKEASISTVYDDVLPLRMVI